MAAAEAATVAVGEEGEEEGEAAALCPARLMSRLLSRLMSRPLGALSPFPSSNHVGATTSSPRPP